MLAHRDSDAAVAKFAAIMNDWINKPDDMLEQLFREHLKIDEREAKRRSDAWARQRFWR